MYCSMANYVQHAYDPGYKSIHESICSLFVHRTGLICNKWRYTKELRINKNIFIYFIGPQEEKHRNEENGDNSEQYLCTSHMFKFS